MTGDLPFGGLTPTQQLLPVVWAADDGSGARAIAPTAAFTDVAPTLQLTLFGAYPGQTLELMSNPDSYSASGTGYSAVFGFSVNGVDLPNQASNIYYETVNAARTTACLAYKVLTQADCSGGSVLVKLRVMGDGVHGNTTLINSLGRTTTISAKLLGPAS